MSTNPGAQADQAQGENSGARRSVMYELFVLGELMDQPHHGYLLHRILTRLLGPFRQVSWGALYPLIHRLEQEGLIVPTAAYEVTDKQARGKQRNVYQITSAGQEGFY